MAPTLKHQFAILGKNSLADIPNAIRINITNHPNHFTLALDLKKAFDTISRQHITSVLESIKNEYPQLAYYWNLIYSGPNRGLTRHGLEHHATQGVLQGDALATLFFCLGINSALISTSQHLLSTDL